MTRTRALATVVAWLLVTLGLWVSDADPSLPALAGIVGVAAAAGLVAFDLGRSVQSVSWPAPTDPTPPMHADGRRVPRALADLDRVVRRQPGELGPRLSALVDDPALRARIQATWRRPPSSRDVTAIVDEIEAL